MKPEHETRGKIIREWMSLPKDKRQTEEQAKPFAKTVVRSLTPFQRRSPPLTISPVPMRWIQMRTGGRIRDR
jgi:hypothetical protein